MRTNRKHPRHKNPSDMDFHGPDRARTKRLMAIENYDALPIRESMRKAVYRGPNGFGDSTSFGNYYSGQVTWKYLDKLLRKYIGKEFAMYYQAMTILFPGEKDRMYLDWFIRITFHRIPKYGRTKWDFSVVDGKIVN
jgi:hypothetical protein